MSALCINYGPCFRSWPNLSACSVDAAELASSGIARLLLDISIRPKKRLQTTSWQRRWASMAGLLPIAGKDIVRPSQTFISTRWVYSNLHYFARVCSWNDIPCEATTDLRCNIEQKAQGVEGDHGTGIPLLRDVRPSQYAESPRGRVGYWFIQWQDVQVTLQAMGHP